MKRTIVICGSALAALGIAYQQAPPKALSQHATALLGAQSLKGTVSLTDLNGIEETVTLEYAKPNMLKIDGPTKQYVCDGETLTTYDKRAKTYEEQPATYEAVIGAIESQNLMGWSWFFERDSAKLIRSVESSTSRKIRGEAVIEVKTLLVDGRTTASFFLNEKSGLASGYSLKSQEKNVIVWSSDLKIGDKAPDVEEFKFVAPAGVTKVESVVSVADAKWAAVSTIFNAKCMPCHSSASRSAGLDLSDFDAARRHRSVVSGNVERSSLVRAIRSGAMPKGRQKLSDNEIKTIENWITGGLKR